MKKQQRLNPVMPLAALVAVAACALTAEAQEPARLAANPVVHPLDADLIAFEQVESDRQELWFRRHGVDTVFPLRVAASRGGNPLQFEGRAVSSYSGDLDWRPVVDDRRLWFAYIATAEDVEGLGLFINYMDRTAASPGLAPLRVAVRGNALSPRWSPDGRHLAFIANDSLYLIPDIMDQARRGDLSEVRAEPIEQATVPALSPAWSPDGSHLAYQVETVTEGVRNWTIEVVPVDTITGRVRGVVANLAAALADVNKYRPSWSLDGKYIAFYMDRPGSEGGARAAIMDIGVIQPLPGQSGNFFQGRVLEGLTRRIAERVLPNTNRGPEWTETSDGGNPPQIFASLVYTKQDEAENNPIMVAAVEQWTQNYTRGQYEKSLSSVWGTVNHKAVSTGELTGRLRYAFIAQSQGTEVLMVEDLEAPWIVAVSPPCLECPGLGRGARVMASLLPGAGHYTTGRWKRGGVLSALGAGGAILTLLASQSYNEAVDSARVALECSSNPGTCNGKAIWTGSGGRGENFLEAKGDRDTAQRNRLIGAGVFAVSAILGMIDNAVYDPRPEWQRVAVEVGPRSHPYSVLADAQRGLELRLVLRH